MPSDLQDCKNGTYKAVVRMDKTGLASIHAQINGQPLGLPATLHVLPAELHSLLLVTPPAIETTAGGHLRSGSSSLHKGTVCSSIYAPMIGRALRVPSTLRVLPTELHSPLSSLHSQSTPQQAGVLGCI